MKILMVYASRYGATREIAERIAARLSTSGFEVTTLAAAQAQGAEGCDAAVIGSAAYYFRWMKPASAFVRAHSAVLAQMPVWLFSSGPLGSSATDEKGRDLKTTTVPRDIAELDGSIHAREHRVFFGAYSPAKLGFIHRMLRRMPANKNDAIFKPGDFRNWQEIDAWADSIAAALRPN